MPPYTTFLCTKFQGNQIICFHFMVTFTLWRKEEKNEEITPIFESLLLRNTWCNLDKILNVGYWQWRATLQQKSSGLIQAAWSYVQAKIVLLFFLSIYLRVWRTGFLGHTTHMCLDHGCGALFRRSHNTLPCVLINILTGVAHWLLGPHDTLPCVLTSAPKMSNTSKERVAPKL